MVDAATTRRLIRHALPLVDTVAGKARLLPCVPLVGLVRHDPRSTADGRGELSLATLNRPPLTDPALPLAVLSSPPLTDE